MSRGGLLRFVLRPLLMAAWVFVSWGTLLLAVTLVHVVSDGLHPALALLAPDSGGPLWAWGNLLCAVAALLVWAFGIGMYWRSRQSERQASLGRGLGLLR